MTYDPLPPHRVAPTTLVGALAAGAALAFAATKSSDLIVSSLLICSSLLLVGFGLSLVVVAALDYVREAQPRSAMARAVHIAVGLPILLVLGAGLWLTVFGMAFVGIKLIQNDAKAVGLFLLVISAVGLPSFTSYSLELARTTMRPVFHGLDDGSEAGFDGSPSRERAVGWVHFVAVVMLCGVAFIALGGERRLLSTEPTPVVVSVQSFRGLQQTGNGFSDYVYAVRLPDGASALFLSQVVLKPGDQVTLVHSRGRMTGRVFFVPTAPADTPHSATRP